MRWSHRHFGTAILFIAALLLVLVYYSAFRAGCLFDGEHGAAGSEAMHISERYSMLSMAAILASFALAFLGIYLLTRRHVRATLAVFLLVLTFGVPFTLWLGISADVHGAQSCKRVNGLEN